MASELAKAYVQIIPSSQGLSGELEKIIGNEAESAGKSGGIKLGNALGTGMKAAGATIAAAGAAVAGITSSFISASGAAAEYGDNIDKMSQKMGISAEAYQEWDAIMQHSGTSIEALKPSMKTLAQQAEKGSDAFQKLGISEEEVATLSQEDLFARVISGLQGMEEGTERTAITAQLLGKGATELGALLNTSAEETQAMRDRVHELGGVMSDEAVKAAAAYQDQLQDMQTAFSGLSRNLMSEFLPDMTNVMSGLTEIFVGNGDSGLALINEGISSMVEGITDKLPQITETGIKILESLASAILENLPKIMSAGMEIVTELAKYIMDSLPMIIQTGMQIIVELALGIAQALPDLIPAALDAVLEFVDALLDNIDLIIDAALQLIVGLAEGLINAIPKLIEKAPTIIAKLVTALIKLVPEIIKVGLELIVKLAASLISNVGKLLSAGAQVIKDLFAKLKDGTLTFSDIGRNIIDGIKNGISNAWNNLVSWFKGLFGDLIQVAKDILGIASPSKVFKQIGEYTTEGFDEGMKDFGVGAMEDVQNAMDEISGMSATVDAIGSSATLSTDVNLAAPSRSADMNAIESLLQRYLPMLENGTNVNVSLQGDAQGLFRQVRKEVNQFTKSTGNSPFIAPA